MSVKVRDHRRELLRMVMIRGGLSPDEMAEVMGRNRRTVYRWLSGDSPVPAAVEKWLLQVASRVVQSQGVES